VQSSSVFGFSILATAAALFGVGASRVLVTTKNWFSSGLEMLLVGSIAAVVAYFIGDLISNIVSRF
jgi:VIT1/CCC1 family predicted Fe2+/Mn2+ transporter